MADVTFFDPKTEGDVKRRRAYAKMLQEQAQQTPNEMVSGIVVKKSPIEALSKALQQGVAGYQEGKASSMEADDAQKKQEMLSRALSSYGQNPEEATNMLMSSPATSDIGLGLFTNKMKTDQEMEVMRQRQAFEERMLGQRMAYDQQITPYQQAQLDLQREALGKKEGITPYQQAQLDLENKKLELLAQRFGLQGGAVDPNTGEVVPAYSNKPLPAPALKMQNELVEDLGFAQSTQQQAQGLIDKIDSGDLNLGFLKNAVSSGKNYIGASDKQSQEYANAMTTLEKLRNDTLRLNKGVQTEGDAVRAMNEVIQSMNDPVVFKNAMAKLVDINNRAVELKKFQIDNIRQNYNAAPMDFNTLQSLPTVGMTQNMLNTPNNPQNIGAQGQGSNPAMTTPYDQIQPKIGGAAMQFNSIEEVEAANLPAGTQVIINGRRAVIE